jgi:hypothetical protein
VGGAAECSVEAMAEHTADFFGAHGLSLVDVLGFSIS